MIYLRFIIITLVSQLFSACQYVPKVKEKTYDINKCRQELLESNDYLEKEGIDLLIIEKKEHKMYLYKGDRVVRVVPVSLGKNPMGAKKRQGDNKTPEGTFWISRKLCSPKYYRSLCISYPLPKDIREAHKRGYRPGGSITIHAQPVWNADGRGDSYTLKHDWTQGCIAVTNTVMHELWYVVREGMVVIIR